MKTIQISKKSWHYRFLEWTSNPYNFRDSVSICEYARTVIINLLVTLFGVTLLLAVAGFVFFAAADTIAWLLAIVISGGYIMPDGPGFMVTLILGIVIIFTMIVFIGKKSKQVIIEKLDTPFIQSAYESWKNKFCVKVKIHE